MKLKALSRYDNDTTTRFGDCILLYNKQTLIIYDCGHERHAKEINAFLLANKTITDAHIVVSHNDSDHTDGICALLDVLTKHTRKVTLYTSLYLKSARKVLEVLDDGKRTLPATKRHILEIFDSIEKVIEKAKECGNVIVSDTKINTKVASAVIVGPTEDEFVEVVAKAIEDGKVSTIDGETVMNAASVHLKCKLENNKHVLLSGDATPEYINNLSDYQIVQLPHHGKLSSAEAIIDKIASNSLSEYTFLISDNTGNAKGGSDAFEVSEIRKGKDVFNTKKSGKPIELGTQVYASTQAASQRYGVYDVVR